MILQDVNDGILSASVDRYQHQFNNACGCGGHSNFGGINAGIVKGSNDLYQHQFHNSVESVDQLGMGYGGRVIDVMDSGYYGADGMEVEMEHRPAPADPPQTTRPPEVAEEPKGIVQQVMGMLPDNPVAKAAILAAAGALLYKVIS